MTILWVLLPYIFRHSLWSTARCVLSHMVCSMYTEEPRLGLHLGSRFFEYNCCNNEYNWAIKVCVQFLSCFTSFKEILKHLLDSHHACYECHVIVDQGYPELYNSLRSPTTIVVGIVTWLRAGGTGVRIVVEPRDFFPSPESPDRHWGPSKLLFSAYHGSFTEVKRTGRDADHRLRVVECGNSTFSGSFAKLREATISLAMSVCVCVSSARNS